MPRPSFISVEQQIEKLIRVNQAGEYGAKRIYEGQIRFIKNLKDKQELQSMLAQEQVHLEYFNQQINIRKIRPTIFMPLWHVGGYIIGAGSAVFGINTAMLITDSVEEVIEKHYDQQIRYLENTHIEKSLTTKLQAFRQDEIDHRETAIQYGTNNCINKLVKNLVKSICKSAIAISKII
ncbi:MAG: demethoxyubiquinone hydroxylase family protein [Rickettsiaceae bacterium]|nr:MAG: demethoxyubiquinone hydroxylase family protein [Rickettsiaceae bacterium]